MAAPMIDLAAKVRRSSANYLGSILPMTDHDRQFHFAFGSVVVTVLRPAKLDSVQFQSAGWPHKLRRCEVPDGGRRGRRSRASAQKSRKAFASSAFAASRFRLFGQSFRGTMAAPMQRSGGEDLTQ